MSKVVVFNGLYVRVEHKDQKQLESLLRGELRCAKCRGKAIVVEALVSTEVEILPLQTDKILHMSIGKHKDKVIHVLKPIRCSACSSTVFAKELS